MMMKRILIFVLLVWSYLLALAQDNKPIVLDQEVVAGRWLETKYTKDKIDRTDDNISSILIFKENLNFHKGKNTEAMIIFDIAGKYSVQGDSINITYFDFSTKRPDSNKPRKMVINVHSIVHDEMKVTVNEPDRHKYEAILTRQD